MIGGLIDSYYNSVTKLFLDKYDAQKLGNFTASRYAQMNAIGGVGKHAMVGAGVGAAYGMASSDTSVLGGALKGAALGVGAHAARSGMALRSALKDVNGSGFSNFERGIGIDINTPLSEKAGIKKYSDLNFGDTGVVSNSDLRRRSSRAEVSRNHNSVFSRTETPEESKKYDGIFGNDQSGKFFVDSPNQMHNDPIRGKEYGAAVDSHIKGFENFFSETSGWSNMDTAKNPLREFLGGGKVDGITNMGWKPSVSPGVNIPGGGASAGAGTQGSTP